MDNVLKAVHLTYSGPGGLGSYLRDFIEGDSYHRFNHVVVFYGIEPLSNELEVFCLERGIEFYYFRKKKKIDIENYNKVWKLIMSLGISVVFLHTYSLSPFCYFRNRSSFKLLCFEHTSSAFKSRQEKVYSLLNWWISDYIIVFFKNHSVINRFKNKTHLIKKTVNLQRFYPRLKKRQNENLVIGMSSRLVKGKRFDLIISALKLLVDDNVSVVFHVAGNGSLLEQMKALVIEKQIESSVVFYGQLPFEELPNFYNDLDAYIHASEGETICYSIMEAQACGLPILASNVTGIKDWLRHEKDGLLFENNVRAIFTAIKELASNNALRQKLSINSLNRSKVDSKGFRAANEIYSLMKV